MIPDSEKLDRYTFVTRVSMGCKACACWEGSQDVPELSEGHTLNTETVGGAPRLTPDILRPSREGYPLCAFNRDR